MGVKKEKSPIQLMEELVVKFGQLYSTDMYIYKRKFCVPGVESSDAQGRATPRCPHSPIRRDHRKY